MSTIRLSGRVNRIKPSPTLAVDARAKALKAQGKDVIGLGAGEPDFHTPDHIKEAAIRAIRDGFTKYTAVDGTPGLKQAVIGKFKRDNGLDYTPDEILISVGGKQSFFALPARRRRSDRRRRWRPPSRDRRPKHPVLPS